MDFHPPIESRDTDELIVMSKASTDEYQMKAIQLAIHELQARGVSQDEVEQRYQELLRLSEAQIQDELAERADMDYALWEKVIIILFWPRYLFRGWYLRRDGYARMASHRIQLMSIGVFLYFLSVLTSIY